MTNDNIKEIINDAHNLAQHCEGVPAQMLKLGIEGLANRLKKLVKDGFYVTPEAAREYALLQKDILDGKSLNDILKNPPFGRTLRMPVISMPGMAAIKYNADDPALPRLAASIETIKSDSGEVSCDCTLYAGDEVLADMMVYRGKTFAVAMVRGALKGAMSRLGKRRRMTANRQAREDAKKEGC